MLHNILEDDQIQWLPPLTRHYTNFDPVTDLDLHYRISRFTQLCEVSIEHLQRVRPANVQMKLTPPDTFRSWVAIFYLRPPMGFLFHILYDMSRLAPLVSGLFWLSEGGETFICKFFGQGYVRERLKSSLKMFYGRQGDIFKQCEAKYFQMLHDILRHDHIHWHHRLIRHFTNAWPCYRTGPFLPTSTFLQNSGRFP